MIRGDHQLFAHDELVSAFSLVVSREKAEAWAYGLLQPTSDELREHYTHWGDDVLDLLLLVSDDCAERVRRLYGQSESEAAARREAVRRKLRLD